MFEKRCFLSTPVITDAAFFDLQMLSLLIVIEEDEPMAYPCRWGEAIKCEIRKFNDRR